MGCAGDSWAGRACPSGMCCSAAKPGVSHPGIRNANTAGNARLHLGLHQTLTLQRMLRSQQASNTAKTGDKGLMRLWDVQKEKQSRTLEEILSPYTESMCIVYSLKIILKFFSLFSKYAVKTGLDWRKILSKGLKKLYLLSLSKGKFRGVVLSVFRPKRLRY